MRNVAILVAASPTPAFYSQLAMLDLAFRKRHWRNWRPSIHAYLGGQRDATADAWWLPRLHGIKLHWTANSAFTQDGDWAQSDDVFRHAPDDVDLIVAMDADTLPVADLEDLLDAVVKAESVAGVIAHYPTVLNFAFDNRTLDFSVLPADPRFPGNSLREVWARLADGLTNAELNFEFEHTLMPADSPDEHRLSPFYLNFGVVLFPRKTFQPVAERYLTIRPRLMDRMRHPDFSGQVALTLAIADAGVSTWAVPMRYNFPNDPVAERMYPDELAHAVVHHYLRTAEFDRHEIFVDPSRYARFLDTPISSVNQRFREAVKEIAGPTYPFA